MWGFGLKSPKPRASQSPLGPKRNNNVQVAGDTLTCFPLLCLWLFPQPLEKPFGKEGGKGSKAPREIGCGGAGCTAPPLLPTCAGGEREVSARLCRPRQHSLCLGITGVLPRLVPFIDSAARSAGVTTGQSLFSPSFPAPFPASVYVVQSLSRKHVEPRPAP